MKSLLIVALMAAAGLAQANCSDNLKRYSQDDKMVKAWTVTAKDTVVYVNNIRGLKPVDISFYGFNTNMARSMEKTFGCKNVRFENAYTEMGLPRF